MLKPAVRVPDAGRWIKVDHAAGDVDRRQGIEKHDCRFAAEAVRDDLGLYVVTGHLGLFQRPHHRKQRTGLSAFEPRRSLGSNRGSGCAARSLARRINYFGRNYQAGVPGSDYLQALRKPAPPCFVGADAR